MPVFAYAYIRFSHNKFFSFTSKHVPRFPNHGVGLFRHLRGQSSRTKPSTNVSKALSWLGTVGDIAGVREPGVAMNQLVSHC